MNLNWHKSCKLPNQRNLNKSQSFEPPGFRQSTLEFSKLFVYTINEVNRKLESHCHEIAMHCFASRVRRLSRVVTAIYDEALRPHRITLNQLNILVFLSQRHGSKLSEVAKYLQMEISTASRNLNRLRKAGLIMVQEGKDARTREFSLSAKGEQQIVKALPAWRDAQKKTNKLLGKETVDALYTASRHTGS